MTKNWVKFNQTAYSSEREYFLYHTESELFPYSWHIVFWPEKGNGVPTIIGKRYVDLTQKEALAWAESLVAEHKSNTLRRASLRPNPPTDPVRP